MPHAKTMEREANVRRVLEVALNCFYHDGIEQTKIADIAEKSGVTSMSIHRYFGDKTSLVLNSYKLFWLRLSRELHAACDKRVDAKASGLDRLKTLMEIYVDFYLKDPQVAVWIHNFENFLHTHSAEIEPDYIELNQPLERAPLIAAVKAGMQDGSIRGDYTADELLSTALSALLGTMTRISEITSEFSDSKAPDAKRQLAMCCDMILSYLKA